MLVIAAALMILVCFVGACICRSRWDLFSRRRKVSLSLAASLLLAIYTFMIFTGWCTTSPLANEIVGALAVGGYSLLVLLLNQFRPKPLTSCITALLLVPVPVALLWLPWSAYSQFPIQTAHVAGTLFINKVRWDTGAVGSSGTTLLIYEKPRFVPFLKHNLQSVVFNDSKCVSDKAFLVLQADGRHVLARCPWYEYQHKQGFHDFLVPLYK